MEYAMKESARSHLCCFFLILAFAPLLLSTPIFAAAVQASERSPVEEELQIQQTVEDLYIKGLISRDFSLITTVCMPQALLMSADKEGKLHTTTLERWSKRFDPQNPPFQKLDYCIVKIDSEGSAAQVKISFLVDSNRYVTDFLHMLKIEGKWRIVNIIDY
jgi:hypothetical protein